MKKLKAECEEIGPEDVLPYWIWEQVLLQVPSLYELARVSQSCKFFNELCYDQYFMVRYFRERQHVWDVLRYKKLDETWCAFCARTMAEKEVQFAKVEQSTNDLERFENDDSEHNEHRAHYIALMHSQRGLLYLTNLRDFDRALRDFEEADRGYGETPMPSALNNMAVAYLYLGNLTGELRYFQMAEEKLLQGGQTGTSSVAGGNLCVALIKQGRFEEALRAAHQATKIARTERNRNPNAFHHKAFALYMMGLPERAVATVDKALKWKPSYCEAHFTRGLALLALDREAEANAAFEEALRLSRESSVWTYCHMYASSAEPSSEGLKPRQRPPEHMDWLSESESVSSEQDDLTRLRADLRARFFGPGPDEEDDGESDEDDSEEYDDDDDEGEDESGSEEAVANLP